uniref:Uncharacterized protein n=1 Tax=Mus spicilegus TaxID=10103 RepID=A0A8C6HN93_MUSSI
MAAATSVCVSCGAFCACPEAERASGSLRSTYACVPGRRRAFSCVLLCALWVFSTPADGPHPPALRHLPLTLWRREGAHPLPCHGTSC